MKRATLFAPALFAAALFSGGAPADWNDESADLLLQPQTVEARNVTLDETSGQILGLIEPSGLSPVACDNFAINGDGTLTDMTTGLVWTERSSHIAFAFFDAAAYVADLTTADLEWRLPTQNELESLYDETYSWFPPGCDREIHICPDFDVVSVEFWGDSNAWYYDFNDGQVQTDTPGIDNGNEVLAVAIPADDDDDTVDDDDTILDDDDTLPDDDDDTVDDDDTILDDDDTLPDDDDDTVGDDDAIPDDDDDTVPGDGDDDIVDGDNTASDDDDNDDGADDSYCGGT
ncbi:MAG: DUF1566 domain-containing protein [Deltaproteobacteria bacterium]|nr:DUF1566 domain-containing protein [Deltaproteobacteria bacterium]